MSESVPEPLPRIDAWISAQDRMTATLNVNIEELSRDMKASFNLQTKYQIDTERELDSRFNKIDVRFDKVEEQLDGMDARFDKVETRLDGMDVRFDKVETRLDNIEAQMATKEDVAALGSRIDDVEARMATKEDVTALEERMTNQMVSMEGRILDAFQQLVAMVIPLK